MGKGNIFTGICLCTEGEGGLPEQRPPGQRDPLDRETPWTERPPGQRDPPGQRPPDGKEQVVLIPLECILVLQKLGTKTLKNADLRWPGASGRSKEGR